MGQATSNNTNNIGNDNLERIKFQQKFLSKDPIIEMLESITPVKYKKEFKHFVSTYKVKKNLKCQYDPIYKIRVIENVRSGRLFNVKIIKRDDILRMGLEVYRNLFQIETSIMDEFKHPNTENIIDIYFDDSKRSDVTLYLITTYTPKESLHDVMNNYIKEKKRFSEKEICTIMKILIETTYKLKNNNILFRNFNPENIFFYKENNYFTLCLRNFYFATVLNNAGTIRGMTGPIWYMAPEILKDLAYDYKSDVWSLGMIMYKLVTLENPFKGLDSREKILQALKQENFFKNSTDLKFMDIHESCISLLYSMIQEDPVKRKPVELLLESNFLTINNKTLPSTFGQLITFDYEDTLKMQKKITNIKPLHDLVFYMVFHLKEYFMNVEEIMVLNEFYKYFDRNNDGQVSFLEIKEQLIADKFDPQVAQDYTSLISVVVDCDFRKKTTSSYLLGSLTYNIFLIANIIIKLVRPKKDSIRDNTNNKIEIMFSEIDVDHSNTISISEIQELFSASYEKNVKTTCELIENNEYFKPGVYNKENSIDDEVSYFDEMTLTQFKAMFKYDIVNIDGDQENEIKNKVEERKNKLNESNY